MSARAARRALIATPAAAIAVLAGAGDATVAAASVSAGDAGAARYWTAERMERVRPLELLRRGPGPALKRAPQPPPFESFQVPDPSAPPLSAHGKLFGILPKFGGFECSATVVDSPTRSVVMTAGHCVYEPRTEARAIRLVFVPAYSDGAEPFGRWSVARSIPTRSWRKHENFDFDYATLVVRPLNGVPIEDAVGARPLATATPRDQVYNAYGYPANFADAELEWSCRGGYAGDDPRPIPGGPAPIGIGCDMKEGASGGGWVNDLGQLVSVTSFGYRRRKGVLYGPYLTPKAARLVARSH